MNAVRLLIELESRGATVTPAGDGLDIEAPPQVLTPKVLEAVRKQKPALLQLLSGRRKRVVLPAPSAQQWDEMNADSYAAASRLRRKLVTSGVVFRVACEAGALRFDEPRLLIEWQKIEADDWAEVLSLRAELQSLVARPSPAISESNVNTAYRGEEEEDR